MILLEVAKKLTTKVMVSVMMEINNAACKFDGGDCCGPNVDKMFCSVCACLEETGDGCFKEDYKGDEICDDGNNNPGCDFDGGDCCLPNVDKTFCTECFCIVGN